MPQRRPSRFLVIIIALTLLALGILLMLLWRPSRPGYPESSLDALAVPAQELAAAHAALEDAELRAAIASPENTLIVISDFSRLLYLSAAESFTRIDRIDPRRTPLIDSLERAFSLSVGDEAWALFYMPRNSGALQEASLALSARAIPILSSLSSTAASSFRLNRLFWLLPLALGLYVVVAKPRHDMRYRLALALSSAPLMLSASVEALLTALALISCAKTLYDSYPLREEGAKRPVMTVGRRLPFLARIAPYAFFVLCMLFLKPAIIGFIIAALALYSAAFVWGPRLAALDRRVLAHVPPAFVHIRPGILSRGYLTTLRVFVLATALGLALGFMSGAANPAASAGAALVITHERVTESEGSPLELHYAYQASLTWGRLGEARWGSTVYTHSSAIAASSGDEGEEVPPTGQFVANALHSALDSGYIPVVHVSKSAATLSASQPLDFKRLLFCILALIPGLGLISYGRLRLS